VQEWLAKHPRFNMHFTPTSASLRIPLIADTHSRLIADSVPCDRGHPGWGA
jgi:hypothetical protein